MASRAARSRRRGAGCWAPRPQPALYGPATRSGGRGAGEDRVGAAPLARIPHLPGRAGAAGTGSGGHRGKRWCGDQTEWNEVDSRKGWVDTGVCEEGRDLKGRIGSRGWAERTTTEEASPQP